jgi:polysaccharide pyruvyl transferase WcaK-like protein
MRVYLKGYYGYRNLGDEILLLGVLRYLQDQYQVTDVTIEADDSRRLQQWLRQHQAWLKLTMRCVWVPRGMQRRKVMLQSLLGMFPVLVLGWGEVISTTYGFPHNGRNYLIQFPGMLWQRKHIVLWGITTPTHPTPRHIQTILRGARSVVLREQWSYDTAHTISPDNTALYHDFAYDALQNITPDTPKDDKPYVIINIHPSLLTQGDGREHTLQEFIAKHESKDIYFLPGDVAHDGIVYDSLSEEYDTLQRRDRTKHALPQIAWFVQWADEVLASRLHVLLLASHYQTPLQSLSYHPKIEKVLGIGHNKQKSKKAKK